MSESDGIIDAARVLHKPHRSDILNKMICSLDSQIWPCNTELIVLALEAALRRVKELEDEMTSSKLW